MNSPKCVQTWLEDRKPAQAKSSELAKLSSVQPTPLLHPSFFSLSPFSTSLRPSICLCFSTPSFPSTYPTLFGVPPLLLEGVRSSKQVNPPPSPLLSSPSPKPTLFEHRGCVGACRGGRKTFLPAHRWLLSHLLRIHT